MNFLVCDDEMKIVEQVSTLLQEHCMENGIHAQIHAFDDPCAIKDYDSYDIAFCDIETRFYYKIMDVEKNIVFKTSKNALDGRNLQWMKLQKKSQFFV